jgi:hypothetical protein
MQPRLEIEDEADDKQHRQTGKKFIELVSWQYRIEPKDKCKVVGKHHLSKENDG